MPHSLAGAPDRAALAGGRRPQEAPERAAGPEDREWAKIGAMPPRVHHHATVDEFLAAAGAFLEEREAENNLLFGISSAIRVTPELFADDPPRFATVTDAEGIVAAATLRAPPHNQVLAWTDELAAIDALADDLRHEDLPGVLGPTAAAARFAARWTDAAGRAFHV